LSALDHRTKKQSENPIFKTLFESAAEGFVVADKQGVIQMTNPRANELFGYDKEELIGQPIEVLIPRELHANHRQHREKYNKAPKKRSMGQAIELYGCKRDQTRFPVEVSLNHFTESGEMFVLALITDVTQRKQAEKEIRELNAELEKRVQARTVELGESQRLYSAIARNYPKGTINVFDRDLNYVFVEGKELYKLGITSEKLIGTCYLDRLSEEISKEIGGVLNGVFEGNQATHEFEYKERHYIMNAVPLEDSEGNINQILVVEQNVTEERVAQEDVRKALIKERELNELKSRFVSMASHEFRTPLSTILSSASLIARYTKPEQLEKREKHINRIKSSVGNLTSVLNDFLSLDKLEQGLIEYRAEEVDIVAHLTELVDEMRGVAKQGQVLEYHCHGDIILVKTDKQLLRNIVTNLLSNAIKYSGEGDTIEVHGEIQSGMLEIKVVDHGMGIPQEDQVHLFSRFFRGHNVINIQGTGLGLNIVKKYVEFLGGDIRFESTEGMGSTFFLSIPINDTSA